MMETIKSKMRLMLVIALCFVLSSNAQKVKIQEIKTRVLNFNWTPDGEDILFTGLKYIPEQPSKSAIFLYKLNEGRIIKIMDDANNPVLSPDGKWIAFTNDTDDPDKENNGNESDIYLYNLDSKDIVPVAASVKREFMPTWSPDSKKIVYSAQQNNKDIDVFITEIKSKATIKITSSNGFRCYSPVWSTDGKHIVYYFEKGDNKDQIFITDPKGKEHFKITTDSTHNFYPSWVDDHRVIYTREPNHIFISNISGDKVEMVEGITSYLARYNNIKNVIAFIGFMKGEEGLVLYNPRTKSKELIIPNEILLNYL